MSFVQRNRAAWDRLVRDGSQFAKVATDEECRDPLQALDGRGWLPASVRGQEVLCLAAGGGWQSILYAAAGAHVTVVDLSPAMLKKDEQEAKRRNYKIRVVEASMDNLESLADESFDIVHQPVSTCYVPDVTAVYREIARVLRDNGLYISQHKQPTSLQISERDERHRYVLGLRYYQEGSLPQVQDESYRESGTVEFLHRWEELVGGLCRCGFVIEDLTEPYRGDPQAPLGSWRHRGLFVAPYLRMKSRRIPRNAGENSRQQLWTPP
jgi:ubiquinone/menaquinone biosynthesis C-methylase UbiE